jgi:hypothetical protein
MEEKVKRGPKRPPLIFSDQIDRKGLKSEGQIGHEGLVLPTLISVNILVIVLNLGEEVAYIDAYMLIDGIIHTCLNLPDRIIQIGVRLHIVIVGNIVSPSPASGSTRIQWIITGNFITGKGYVFHFAVSHTERRPGVETQLGQRVIFGSDHEGVNIGIIIHVGAIRTNLVRECARSAMVIWNIELRIHMVPHIVIAKCHGQFIHGSDCHV